MLSVAHIKLLEDLLRRTFSDVGESLSKLERRIFEVIVLVQAPDVRLVLRQLLLSHYQLVLLLDNLGCQVTSRNSLAFCICVDHLWYRRRNLGHY